MSKPVTDRHELCHRMKRLRYETMEETIGVLIVEPSVECDRLIESVLDGFKGLEALLSRS